MYPVASGWKSITASRSKKSLPRYFPLAVWMVTSVAAMAQTPVMPVVSAATFSPGATLAPGMIVTAFTSAVPDQTSSFSIAVRDSAGVERPVSPLATTRGQISFVIPAGTSQGAAMVTLARGGAAVASAAVQIGRVSPGLFTANVSGEGPPAGQVTQVASDGSRTLANLFELFNGSTRYQALPFDTGAPDVETYLMLYGTGIRG